MGSYRFSFVVCQHKLVPIHDAWVAAAFQEYPTNDDNTVQIRQVLPLDDQSTTWLISPVDRFTRRFSILCSTHKLSTHNGQSRTGWHHLSQLSMNCLESPSTGHWAVSGVVESSTKYTTPWDAQRVRWCEIWTADKWWWDKEPSQPSK